MRGHSCAIWLCAATALLGRYCHAGERMQVKVEKAEVKMGEKVLAILPKGKVVEVIAREGVWIGVSVVVDGKTIEGWVNKLDLEPLERRKGELTIPIKLGGAVKQVSVPRTLLLVRMKKIVEVEQKVQQLLMQINPLLPGVLSVQAVASTLNWDELAGLDQKRPLVFGVTMGEEGLEYDKFALLPYDNFKALRDAFAGNGWSVAKLGTYAVVSDSAESLREVVKAVKGFQGVAIGGMLGDVETALNVPLFFKYQWEELSDTINEGFSGLREMEKVAPQMVMAFDLCQAIMKWYADVGRQVKTMRMGVGFEKEGFKFYSDVEAFSGTTLAKIFSGAGAPKHEFGRLLRAGEGLVLLSIDVGEQDYINLADSFFEALNRSASFSSEEMRKVLDLSRKVISAWDGRLGKSVVIEKGALTTNVVAGVSGDAKKLADECRRGFTSFGSKVFKQTYALMGLIPDYQYRVAARRSHGYDVDVSTLRIKVAENAPNVAEAQKQMRMMKEMMGDPIVSEYVYFPHGIAVAGGKNASSTMDALLGRLRAAERPLPRDIRVAQETLGKNANVYMTVSFNQVIAYMDVVCGATVPGVKLKEPPKIESPPVMFSAKCVKDRLSLFYYFPVKPLGTLQGYFMTRFMEMQRAFEPPGDVPDVPPAPQI